jgi:hypothetical protein
MSFSTIKATMGPIKFPYILLQWNLDSSFSSGCPEKNERWIQKNNRCDTGPQKMERWTQENDRMKPRGFV